MMPNIDLICKNKQQACGVVGSLITWLSSRHHVCSIQTQLLCLCPYWSVQHD